MTARRWPLLALLLGLGGAIAAPQPPQQLTMQRQPRDPVLAPRPAAAPGRAELPPPAQTQTLPPARDAQRQQARAEQGVEKPQARQKQARQKQARQKQARARQSQARQAQIRQAAQRKQAQKTLQARVRQTTQPQGSARSASYKRPSAPGAPRPPVPAQISAAAHAHWQWVLRTGDHEHGPFAVIDKRQARLWLFDARGQRLGSTPVLLGLARGDASVAGIGTRPMSQIRPHERTTPAGRFMAEPGRNSHGEDIFWVDYDAAVSLHRVRATHPVERRLQRLASATPADNRISYGCINVPAAFYDRHIQPAFTQQRGVVYLLPETLPMTSLFTPAQQPLRTAGTAPAGGLERTTP